MSVVVKMCISIAIIHFWDGRIENGVRELRRDKIITRGIFFKLKNYVKKNSNKERRAFVLNLEN